MSVSVVHVRNSTEEKDIFAFNIYIELLLLQFKIMRVDQLVLNYA